MRPASLFVLIILLFGCTTLSEKPVCRHTAVYSAITWQDLTGEKVKIIVGRTAKSENGEIVSHAQAINEDGEWLYYNWLLERIEISKQDPFFIPEKHFTIREFLNQMMLDKNILN